MELADKPGSVEDSHSSGTSVATCLKQPTRIQCGPHLRIPIWSCSERGLPCHGLLPAARCALTAPFHPYRFWFATSSTLNLGGLLSVALSVGSLPPGVTWRSALWSPDFPPSSSIAHASESSRRFESDCLADSGAHTTRQTLKSQAVIS